MDYIIFGIGTSASLVLVGWLLRDWGPWLRDRKPPEDEILSANQLVERMGWARFCAACGMALVLCGVLVMLVTVVVMVLGPNDGDASIAVLAAVLVSVCLMLVWTSMYLRQFGSVGVHRPIEKTVPEPAPGPVEPAGETSTEVGDDAATPLPAPTFAEAAASRGGLSRFAGFLRRDATGVSTEDAPTVSKEATRIDEIVPGKDAETDVGLAAAEIAELQGGSDEAESKKLSDSDPLVTSVRAEIAAMAGVGLTPAADLVGAELDSSLAAPDPDREEAAVSPAGDRPNHDLALENLRKRRLERLANTADPE